MDRKELIQIEKNILRKTVPLVLFTSFVVSVIVGAMIGIVGSSLAKVDMWEFLSGKGESFIQQDESREKIRLVPEEEVVIEVVKKASPAVVSIIVSEDVPIIERYYEQVPLFDEQGSLDPLNFFNNFNIRTPKYRQKGTEQQRVGAGTGFLVSSDGYIITNKHVVEREDALYTVITNDDKKFTAKVLSRDPTNDIAILKIDAIETFSYLDFGDSDNLQVGQTVIAIGYALGMFDNSVSKGVVSGLARSINASGGGTSAEHLEGIIQTDAAINPGNSGGPLLDIHGQVIGVNVAIYQGVENVGFALGINDVKTVYESVLKYGKIVRPMLGVRYVLIDEAMQKENNLSVNFGALIVHGQTPAELAVIPGSPADKAGLEENDIILEVDGEKVDSEHSLARLLRNKKVGDSVEIRVSHDGNERNINVILEEMK